MRLTVLMAMILAAAGCGEPKTGAKMAPDPQKVLRLLLSLRDLPLKSLPSCNSKEGDIGDFVAYWMGELKAGQQVTNSIEVTTQEEEIPKEHDRGWRCTVKFKRTEEGKSLTRGVVFVVRGADRTPILESVECLSAN